MSPDRSPPLRWLLVLLPVLVVDALLAMMGGLAWTAALGFAYTALAVAELAYLTVLLTGCEPDAGAVPRDLASGD